MKEEIKNVEWLQKQLDQVDRKWLKCSNCKYGHWQGEWPTRSVQIALFGVNLGAIIGFSIKHLWLNMIGPMMAIVVLIVMNVFFLSSPKRWEWCENRTLRLGLAAKRAAEWIELDHCANAAWYMSQKDGVPVKKNEYNSDGACMYYKRTWWKFWAPK